jgi:acyl dehydratase
MHETWEAVAVGWSETYGTYEVTAAEIVEFAEQYDPQPFHTDPEAARESMFGGLAASGWHTAAMTMRLLVDNYFNEAGAMGSPGVDELRWHEPVRPGDELSITVEVLEKEAWDDERGTVRSETETHREDGTVVQSMVSQVLYPRER